MSDSTRERRRRAARSAWMAMCAGALAAGCAAPVAKGPVATASAATASGGAAEPAEAPADEGFPVHGQVATRYRYRAIDGESDQDVTSTVAVDVGDPELDGWSGHVLGWLAWDVDGTSGGPGDAFVDITDSYDSPVTGRLYAAYADYRGADGFETLRFGRQEVSETPVLVAFDGVRAESVEFGDGRVRLEAYGGVPAHFFESSSSGDLVAGLAATMRPWEGGRVRLDWMHLEDEALLGAHADDLLGLSAWQRLNEAWNLGGRATMLAGEGRDARLRATYVDAESELTLFATYYVLYQRQNDLVQELDPFTATLLALEPYHSAQVLATKALDEDLLLEGGYERRQLLHPDDEGEFNREFGRLHASATHLDLFDEGLALRLDGELWDATGIRTSAWGADLTRDFGPAVEASVGSYFALYKYDFLLAQEREDVRTYYAELELHRTRWATFDVRYEYENGPLDDYHLLKVGMRWRF